MLVGKGRWESPTNIKMMLTLEPEHRFGQRRCSRRGESVVLEKDVPMSIGSSPLGPNDTRQRLWPAARAVLLKMMLSPQREHRF